MRSQAWWRTHGPSGRDGVEVHNAWARWQASAAARAVHRTEAASAPVAWAATASALSERARVAAARRAPGPPGGHSTRAATVATAPPSSQPVRRWPALALSVGSVTLRMVAISRGWRAMATAPP